jgi:hypothetical protein
MLDQQGISTRFKAGISVVALSSPTAAENAVIQALVQEFGTERSIQTWDCSNQLQIVRARMNGQTVTGIERQPDTSFQVQGHPVEALLKHITNLCQNPHQSGAKTYPC